MNKSFFLFISLLIFAGCSNNSNSKKYNRYFILNQYEIDIPDILKYDYNNTWTNKSERKTDFFKIEIKKSYSPFHNLDDYIFGQKTLDEVFEQNANRKLDLNVEVHSKDMKGLMKMYSKDLNKGVIPVVVYTTYIALLDGDSILSIQTTSLIENQKPILDSIIKSIKKTSVSKVNP